MTKLKMYVSLAALTLCWGCAQQHSHQHEHEHEGHEHEGHEEHKHVDGVIELAPERAAALGVSVDTLKLQSVSDIITVTGEVITDPAARAMVVAPVSGRVTFTSDVKPGTHLAKGRSIAAISGSQINGGDANRAAAIELEAAEKELRRLTPLREEGLATAAEYNAALKAVENARNAIGTAGGSATSPIAGVITEVCVANGQYVEAGQPIAYVADNRRLTVRADVPKRHAQAASGVKTARVFVPYLDLNLEATVSAPPAGVMANAAYQPVYFNVSDGASLSPGSYVEVYLRAGESHPGIMVPEACVTDRLGQKFVYVRLDDDCYERRPVTLGTTDGSMVEVTSGLGSGDVVVTGGTTYVRLAESSNVAVPGHTHNH